MPLRTWIDEQVRIVSGRHGLSAETVRQTQRGRLLEAAARLTAERGYRGMTAAELTKRAGVSRSTLYELFDSRDGCFYTAAREAHEHLVERLYEVASSEQPTREQIDQMIETFMAFCADHPNAAQLVLLGVAGSGHEGGRLRSEWLDDMTERFRGPLEARYVDPPRMTAEMLVGGLWHVAGSRIRADRAAELPLLGRVLSAYMLRDLTEREISG